MSELTQKGKRRKAILRKYRNVIGSVGVYKTKSLTEHTDIWEVNHNASTAGKNLGFFKRLRNGTWGLVPGVRPTYDNAERLLEESNKITTPKKSSAFGIILTILGICGAGLWIFKEYM